MHPFRKRGLAALLLFVAMLTGCQPLKPHSTAQAASNCQPPATVAPSAYHPQGVRPPSDPAFTVGTPLPTDTVDMVAANLRIPSLRNMRLVVRGKFTTSTGNVTILTTQGGKQLVSTDQVQSAVDELTRLAGSSYQMELVCLDKPLQVTAQASVRQAAERLIVYVGSADDIRAIRLEIDYTTSIAAVTDLGFGGYVASFIPNVPFGNPTVLGRQVPPGVTGTYIEACQNVLNLAIQSADSAQAAVPEWQGQNDAMRNGAQETVCNSLGVAMTVSRDGMAYDAYEAAVNARATEPPHVVKGVGGHTRVIDKKTYDGLKDEA